MTDWEYLHVRRDDEAFVEERRAALDEIVATIKKLGELAPHLPVDFNEELPGELTELGRELYEARMRYERAAARHAGEYAAGARRRIKTVKGKV